MRTERISDFRGTILKGPFINPSEWEIERTYREGTDLVVVYRAARKMSSARYKLVLTYAECLVMFGALAEPA